VRTALGLSAWPSQQREKCVTQGASGLIIQHGAVRTTRNILHSPTKRPHVRHVSHLGRSQTPPPNHPRPFRCSHPLLQSKPISAHRCTMTPRRAAAQTKTNTHTCDQTAAAPRSLQSPSRAAKHRRRSGQRRAPPGARCAAGFRAPSRPGGGCRTPTRPRHARPRPARRAGAR